MAARRAVQRIQILRGALNLLQDTLRMREHPLTGGQALRGLNGKGIGRQAGFHERRLDVIAAGRGFLWL
jgi:hypothetical protein